MADKTIPEIREEMLLVIESLKLTKGTVALIGLIGSWEQGLHRAARSNPRAPVTSMPMTAELARDIRDYKAVNPDVAEHEIAEVFRVNQGRVSEALAGKR